MQRAIRQTLEGFVEAKPIGHEIGGRRRQGQHEWGNLAVLAQSGPKAGEEAPGLLERDTLVIECGEDVEHNDGMNIGGEGEQTLGYLVAGEGARHKDAGENGFGRKAVVGQVLCHPEGIEMIPSIHHPHDAFDPCQPGDSRQSHRAYIGPGNNVEANGRQPYK